MARKYVRIFIESIEREPGHGHVRLNVRFGREPAKDYLAEYDGADPKYQFCQADEELFFLLSELAVDRYCNAAIYQMELMGIIRAFVASKSLPPFPIELGTTKFGLRRPSRMKILATRIRRPFLLAWYWWKFRNVRKFYKEATPQTLSAYEVKPDWASFKVAIKKHFRVL